MDAPVKYARCGDVHLAYRIFEMVRADIVLISGTLSHGGNDGGRCRSISICCKDLFAFSRVIVFDKRGPGPVPTGSSPPPTIPSRNASATSRQSWMAADCQRRDPLWLV